MPRARGEDGLHRVCVGRGLVRNIASTTRKLHIDDRERPVAIQIYGRDPEAMVDAAKMVEEAQPDPIDINFGCPVKKVAGKGEAYAGMLRDIPKMLAITEAVVKGVSLPVTVKTRLGWDCENKIITDLGSRLQDCGIAAITVHGRTRSQMYTGGADWSLIGELKSDPRMVIPVIGNGDITTPEAAADAFDKYGVDGVMIGRGSIGATWIFHGVEQYLREVRWEPLPDFEKFALFAQADSREHRPHRRISRNPPHPQASCRHTPCLKVFPTSARPA